MEFYEITNPSDKLGNKSMNSDFVNHLVQSRLDIMLIACEVIK